MASSHAEDDSGAEAAAATAAAAAAPSADADDPVPPPHPTPEQQRAALEAAERLKAEGNDLYRAKDHGAALDKYLAAADEAGRVVVVVGGDAADADPDAAASTTTTTSAAAAASCRAVYFANAAACAIALSDWSRAADLSGRAIELRPAYAKALMRRSAAREALDDPEGALADARRVAELAAAEAAGSAPPPPPPTPPSSSKEDDLLPVSAAALATTSAPPDRAAQAWARSTVARLEPLAAERQERMKAEVIGKLKELGNTILGRFGMSVDDFRAEKDPSTGSYSIKFGRGGGGAGGEQQEEEAG